MHSLHKVRHIVLIKIFCKIPCRHTHLKHPIGKTQKLQRSKPGVIIFTWNALLNKLQALLPLDVCGVVHLIFLWVVLRIRFANFDNNFDIKKKCTTIFLYNAQVFGLQTIVYKDSFIISDSKIKETHFRFFSRFKDKWQSISTYLAI